MRDYGITVWHLLYQADVRMRSEEFPDIYQELVEERDAIKKAGGTRPVEGERLWQEVCGAVLWTRRATAFGRMSSSLRRPWCGFTKRSEEK